VSASAVLDGGPVSRTERAFPCLDGARAIAATAVVITHVSFWTGDHGPDLLGRASARLDVGVAIFFVLSGFLLSRPLFLAAATGRPAPRTAAYLWRRALRILPAYWLTVAAALLLLPGNAGAGPAVWLRHLTLTQIYGAGWIGEGLSHTWSLCTEVAFYALLPLAGAGLVRLARPRLDRPGRVLLALGAVTLLGLVWLAWLWATRPSLAPLDLWLPSFPGWFAAGMALAVLSVADPAWWPARRVAELGSSLATCWAGAAALFWIATSTVAGPVALAVPTPGQAVTKSLLYLGVAALVVLPLVFGDQRQGTVRRVLASPPVAFLGEISYGLFLVHVLVLAGGYAAFGWVPFTGNVVLVLLGTWVVSALLAGLVYVLVERPLRRWRNLVPASRSHRGSGNTDAVTAVRDTSASV
jgi:peptidoglycan/LPS O-acetylase OafA/YrhL